MIEEKLNDLIDQNISFESKIKIVKCLNKDQYDGEILARVATFFLSKASEILIEKMPTNTIDIVGTGGDGFSTLNYSTLSALLLCNESKID